METSIAQRVAVWSAAGGVGKTTTTINLAAALAERGQRVLIVDLDPHACLLRAFGQKPRLSLHAALEDPKRMKQSIRPSEFAGIHLLTASPDLDTNEHLLRAGASAENQLRDTIRSLGAERWNFLLLDCGANVNRIAVAAMGAADTVITPVEPSPISAGTLSITFELADAVRRHRNPDLSPLRVLLSRVSDTPTARTTIRALRERFEERIMNAEIPHSAAVVDASASFEPVLTYREDDPASLAFRSLAGELLIAH